MRVCPESPGFCERQGGVYERRHGPCQSAAWHEASGSYELDVTSAIANPSYPLLPTVWIAVALTRGSAATRSMKRRMPLTLSSSLATSTTAPRRTTLSTMIIAPGRESFSAQVKYSAVDALSASIKVRSNGATAPRARSSTIASALARSPAPALERTIVLALLPALVLVPAFAPVLALSPVLALAASLALALAPAPPSS